MNYSVTNEWQSLSEIMGSDYNPDAVLRIHNNVSGVCNLAWAMENTAEVGALLPSGCDLYNDKGLDIYLRVNSKNTQTYNNALYITEVTEGA